MLQGKNVVLRLAQQQDFMRLLTISAHNSDWLFWDAGELALDELLPVLCATEAGTMSRLWCAWQDKEIIGFVTLNDINPIHRSAEVRYLGLMAEKPSPWLAMDMLDTLLGFSFGTLNLHRIYGKVYVSNKPMNRLFEHKGFALEGTQRQALWRKSRFESINVYSLLAEEWTGQKVVEIEEPKQGE